MFIPIIQIMSKDSNLSSAIYSSSPPSLQSSSLDSVLLHRYKLSSRDRERLENIYQQISAALLQRRQKKIELLERYELAIGERAQVETEIRRIETSQQKKIAAQRQSQEALMLSLLKQREQGHRKLKEIIKHYQISHPEAKQKTSIQQTEQYIHQVRERVRLQSQVQRLQQEERMLARQNEGAYLKDLQLQVMRLQNKRQSVDHEYQIKVVEPIIPKPKIRDLSCNQIKAMMFNWSLQNQKDEIYSLLKQVKYPQQSFGEIQSFILEEQAQKEALFEDLMKLKEKLQLMQAQNERIQSLLLEQQKRPNM